MDATVMYAGSAPGLVAGVMQINVQIPQGTPSGNVPVANRGGWRRKPGRRRRSLSKNPAKTRDSILNSRFFR